MESLVNRRDVSTGGQFCKFVNKHGGDFVFRPVVIVGMENSFYQREEIELDEFYRCIEDACKQAIANFEIDESVVRSNLSTMRML